ncbi:MAG: LacI family DNA-binding transcriptional regulator [Pseudomonadota bacterium]
MGGEKPTLASVAKAAGVSVPTVSQVMRGTGRISEQTRQRVIEAATKLHYVRNSRAAEMRSGESREIGIVINQFANPFNAEVISGAVDLLETEGYLASILDTRDDHVRQWRQLEAFIRAGRAGLLWVPAQGTEQETLDLLRTHGTPTVTFLRPVDNSIDHVGLRNAEATATATHHLLALGHRNIAYLGGTTMTSVRRDRIAGYRSALAEAGLDRAMLWPSPDTKPAGLASILRLRQEHPNVTAVVCNGDMVALGACQGLIRAGLQPGRDVSVIGFDDIEDASVSTPALTTMAVSPQKLGRKLGRTLLDRIQEPDMPATRTEISAELVIRDTTGSPLQRR